MGMADTMVYSAEQAAERTTQMKQTRHVLNKEDEGRMG